ncbi:DUF2268 domain-containing putative Zn-dependent protease [Evansella sp. AB-P1]|uniref:DUF2268 domain-containing protein n=1 Tax=Evansella sp. AB-P1 TaxID=3037653 RepID=UPI00241D0A7C|nr:DUF2268 domain-containing putative Zn-dependent protease [Evansella sp. AB-P1]MDG5789146.1 DUF2268 domain-containing putative Zn-dependent protease [Evansella sp. AB-P1]
MPFINTRVWLKHLFDKVEGGRLMDVPPFNKMMHHFPEWTEEEWLHFLYRQGMLHVNLETKEQWIRWQKKGQSKGVQEYFEELQLEFKGPDVDIFLFPIDWNNNWLMKGMKGKNGITFPEFILLFIKDKLPIKEKKALLLHEYHHACRLFHQDVNEKNVTLLESIIMEGLAEWEVEKRLGNNYVAPWMTLYSEELLINWWKRGIGDRKMLQGRKKHVPYLYGGTNGYPKWIGYSIGFHMVKSYMANYKKISSLQLLKTEPTVIFQNSCFNINKDEKN